MSEQHQEYKADRKGWPPGEWDNEPDRLDFIHAGLSCMLLRGPVGSWCGYCGVPETHPAFGKKYDDVDVQVHGGLTYAGECQGHICHVPEPSMPDKVFWLGFDTAHLGDASPGMMRLHEEYGFSDLHGEESYKNMAYARMETERLAEQLAEQR